MNSICYTNTKHISYESKVTIHHLFSNFISEVYALDTNSYVKQEAAGKVDDLLQKGRKRLKMSVNSDFHQRMNARQMIRIWNCE